MSWKAMSPSEACDLMDFWADAAWPLSRDAAQKLAVHQFGWSIEIEDGVTYLMNTVSGFTHPDVSTIGDEKSLSELSLKVSDVIRDVTRESTDFLGDAFTLLVREGEARWGNASVRQHRATTSARWDDARGGRIWFSVAPKSLNATFETPQWIALDKRRER